MLSKFWHTVPQCVMNGSPAVVCVLRKSSSAEFQSWLSFERQEGEEEHIKGVSLFACCQAQEESISRLGTEQ